jgi:DNA-binding Lrp family transcriptional regulator
MANKNSNVSYDQIPHIVINHPDTNPEHQSIMRALYKVLKDFPQCIYSNKALSEECRIPLRTVERRISELKKMMLINSIGTSYNRRLSLGLLFNTTANVADKNLTPPPNHASQTAKSDVSDRHGGGYTNPSTKPSSKEDLSFSNLNHWETKEIQHCIRYKVPLNSDFKYLQPLLDEALKNEKITTID